MQRVHLCSRSTRQSLADAALALLLERGYDQVGIRDVADAADVSTTTLFKHFPVKEALVFDEDAGQEADLLAAGRSDPETAVAHAFQLLEHGWTEIAAGT